MRGRTSHSDRIDPRHARDALFAIDPGQSRDDWHGIGRAAIAAGLSVDDLVEWSAGAPNFAGERDVRAAFRTVKPDGGTGPGTLWKAATAAGWRPPKDAPSPQARQAPARAPQAPQRPDKPRRGPSAAEVWSRCAPAPESHGYIIAKRGTHEGLRVVPDDDPLTVAGQRMAGALVVPVYPLGSDEPVSLQFIGTPTQAAAWKAAGRPGKLNLPGASVAGVFVVGDLLPGGVVYIVEGIGQAWACWQATGHAAVVAFGWGRVKGVAAELRQRDPDARLVLVPDAGKEADARAIAAEVGAAVACMPAGSPDNFDANDYAQAEGVDALDVLLAKASELPKASEKPAFTFVAAGELLRSDTRVEYLVDELIEHPSLFMLVAPEASGKSFLALGWACSVATGTPWIGRESKQGPVFYLAGEGFAGLRRRMRAWELHTGTSLDAAPLFVSKTAAALMDAESAASVTSAVQALCTHHGPPALLVVDTFARNMGPGDENSNTDVGVFVSHVDAIRQQLGCSVLIVHHSGHQEKGRGRGASSLQFGMDARFTLEVKAAGIELTNPKQKDGEPIAPMLLELKQIPLHGMVDAKGRELTSAVLVKADTGAGLPYNAPKLLTPRQHEALQAYRRAAEVHGLLGAAGDFMGLHVEAWRGEFYRTCTNDTSDGKKKAFQRTRNDLVESGHLTVDADVYRLAGHASGHAVLEIAQALREKNTVDEAHE